MCARPLALMNACACMGGWCRSAWACACPCTRVASLILHATRVCRTVLSFVACLPPASFSTLADKRHDFSKKVTDHKIRVSIFSTNCVQNISYCKENSATYFHKFENIFI